MDRFFCKTFFEQKCTLAIFLLFLLFCNNHKAATTIKKEFQNQAINSSKMEEDIFLKKVIIILSAELNKTSSAINIQDYIANGKSFIPFFSSVEKFNESTKGMVKNPKIEIDGILFLSMLNGTETLKLNPGLNDEMTFKSSELKNKYSSEIEQFNLKMKKLKEENPAPPTSN